MKATINGITMGYDDVGTGPAVVLLHGSTFCRRMWAPHIKALEGAGYRGIIPDLRGFGESKAPERFCDISTYADDIIALLNYLGIGRAVIGGVSLGGEVMLDLQDRYLQRVAAVLPSRVITGDGHMVNVERPTEFKARLVGFLDGLGAVRRKGPHLFPRYRGLCVRNHRPAQTFS